MTRESVDDRSGSGLESEPVDHPAWIDTYRGTVFPWETDIVEHLTVAYYFERFADATLNLLESLGLGADYMAAERRGCVTVDCYVRYMHELRVGDILHISSAVIGVEETALRLGHRVVNSATEVLCATVEQRVIHMDLGARTPAPLRARQRRVAEARRVTWDGPARETRWQPEGTDGFLESAHDTVKPWEIDVFGQSAFPHYIHRFSAGGIQTFAAFGMTPAYMRDERRGMSTFEFQLEFRGSLHAGDPVRVKTGLLHLGNSSIRVFHRMFNGRTGAQVASLDQFGVHLDVDARRPTPLPAALRERAQAILLRPKE
jgi:acyl-CoA thioester hydrolase